jgi:uncharacterized OB-fold protein
MRDQDFFWEGVSAGKLLIQKCQDCGTLRQPPGPMCPHCQSLKWTAHESRGRGAVAAWIISKHPTQPDQNARIVALIDLEDGVRMISNLQNVSPDDMDLGMPVELFFAEVNGTVLPQFRPSSEA